jgi:serine/threonine protein kinase
MEGTIQVPGYEIQSRIGDTALTEVWRAWQPALQRQVALKVLKAGVSEDPETVERFIGEAREVANLRHPAIVAIYNVMRHEGLHIVVMEHAEGPTLHEVLTQRGRVPWARSAEIAWLVADALRHAWDQSQLIHRCVSPASIRIEPGGAVKLAYMGLSLCVDPERMRWPLEPGSVEGVPYYMSPEQARGSVDLDFRTDMYGLGATLYHMTTGMMPFGDQDPMGAIRCQLESQLPNPVRFCPDLPPALLHTMAKLMRRDPSERHRDWADAIAELRRAGSGHMIFQKQVRAVPSVIDTAPPAKARAARARPRMVLKKKG